jgi:hypothetical protein
MSYGQVVSFIWSIADLIRDSFRRGEYQSVILPLTVLRRLDCVLAATKKRVLETNAKLRGKLGNLEPQLRKASGFAFYNTSRYDRDAARFEVENGITSGDYLQGFLRGTRGALYEKGRESITMSISEVNAFNIGMLIALYDRAVGFYGSLVNVNAYDQPGVEAGKKAASKLLQLQKEVHKTLSGEGKTAEEIARSIDADPEDVFHLLRHLASNDPDVKVIPGEEAVEDLFSLGQTP